MSNWDSLSMTKKELDPYVKASQEFRKELEEKIKRGGLKW